MRRVLFVTAAVVAAVIFFALATLPPKPLAVDTSGMDPDIMRRTVRGAYHVHTDRSDGASDKPTIAAAAARAGLEFIIFTDHGDGTSPGDPPAYLSGVLCIDGVEISTNGGHYVALGMTPSPYPLGGDPSAVVEDVRRLGGFGIVAHPDSPKASLAWTDWDAPIDGLEWLNADSEWRDESRAALAHVLLSYPFRPGPALASMFDRPRATLKRWDDVSRYRRVVALAGHDAHGGIGRGVEESGARKRTLGHVPSYEASFRTFTNNVILAAPPSGNAAQDAGALIDSIRRGFVYTVIDAMATPGYVDVLPVDAPGAGFRVNVKATLPPRGEFITFENGSEKSRSTQGDARMALTPGEGPVRFEVDVPDSPGAPPVWKPFALSVPWLLTNAFYSSAAAAPRPRTAAPLVAVPFVLTWHVEKDPRSVAMVTGSGGAYASLQYELAPGAKSSQFAALAGDIRGRGKSFTNLLFVGSAVRPSRISVQLRYASGERWGSSVYVDSSAREMGISIARMRPLDRQGGPAPDPGTASSLLVVADLTNAKPGDSNTFTIANLRIAR